MKMLNIMMMKIMMSVRNKEDCFVDNDSSEGCNYNGEKKRTFHLV